MKSKTIVTLLFALLYVVLFYHKTWGLNLFIFQITMLLYLFIVHRKGLSKIHYFILAGTLVSVISAFGYHSYLALLVSGFSLLAFAASVHYQEVKSVHLALISSLLTIPKAFGKFVLSLSLIKPKKEGAKFKMGQSLFYVLVIPIVLLFLFLYGQANPSFGNIISSVLENIDKAFIYLFADINWDFIFYFILGLSITIPLLYNYILPSWVKLDIDNFLTLNRSKIRKRHSEILFKMSMGLKLETEIGVFLMMCLNLSLLLLLYFEIRDVWFGFTWDGGMLKEFVHQGIWILIISILISMGLALYFFRDNLNFYSKAKKLKILMYSWIFLNLVLTLSVFVRAFIYIEYFALAYKRIGLVFFLLAVLIGLITVVIKIREKRNVFYLIRVNSWSVYVLFIVMCVVNWDVVIAKYNLSRKNVAFVHLNFMVTLSDKALPYLMDSPQELKNAQGKHKKMLRMDSSSFEQEYMKAETYGNQLEMRKRNFISRWEMSSWLEWNPADYYAYEKLKE